MKSQGLKKLKIPDLPGVYFFKDGNGKTMYIGRATSLRSRVRSYFRDDVISTRGSRIVDMVTKAKNVKFEKTDSVLEAIILEANLIKRYQPKYNTDEKDDKSWNYIVITDEKWPRIIIERGRNLEKSKEQRVKSKDEEKIEIENIKRSQEEVLVHDDSSAATQDESPPMGGFRHERSDMRKSSSAVVGGAVQDQKILSLLHKTIKKVSEDIENMHFNTAVSALMILLNEFEKPSFASPFGRATEGKEKNIAKEYYEIFLQLLAPFAPHITEELWNLLGNKKSIHAAPWPMFNPSLLLESSVKMVVQVNGKTRAEMEVSATASDEEVKTIALALESVKKWLNGVVPTRIIVVKGRLINIVVQG